MVLVPTNMSRFDFSPYNFLFLFLVPAKYFVFENSPSRDYSQKENILQGLFLKSKYMINVF